MSSDLSDSDREDLDASNTESDEGSEDEIESADESNTNTQETPKLSAEDRIKDQITEKYKSRQGKQLFIRFPARLPEDEEEFNKQVKALSKLITKAHKPRQKYARFCLVDFNSQSDRDEALKSLKAAIKAKTAMKGLVVSIPRTESEEFVNDLVDKKLKSIEAKKTRARLRRATKQAERAKYFTPTVVALNLPSNVSMVKLRELFPNAVDIQMSAQSGQRPSKAAITLPTTLEARNAVRKNLSLDGKPLTIRFDVQKKKSRDNKTKSVKKPEKKQKPSNEKRFKKVLES